MKQTPRVKIVCRALGLTQEEFAARFMILIGTLRDWEQGRVQSDWPARVFLRVIAVDAAAVQRALAVAVRSLSFTTEAQSCLLPLRRFGW